MVPDEEKVALDGVSVDATFYLQTKEAQRDLKIFLRDTQERLKQRLEQAIKQKRGGVKWNLFLLIELKIEQTYSEYPWRVTPTLRAGPYTSTHPDKMFTHFQAGGSGWALERNIYLCRNIAEYQPFRGSSYIPLPAIIEKKKAVINIKNEDEYCFMWAILAGLHPVSIHPERVSHYRQYRGELTFEGIQFPVSCEGIKIFERENPFTSVTVIGYEVKKKCQEGDLFPYYVPDR